MPLQQPCEITTVTRRFCQKCRLDKCFTIGMRKDLIMSEEDKVAKRQKIEENKSRKRNIEGFKSGFKKMKKEMVEPDSCSNGIYGSDNDTKDSFSQDRCSQFSNSNIGTTLIRKPDEKVPSPAERLVSSSDDVTVAKTTVPSKFVHSNCGEATGQKSVSTSCCNNNTPVTPPDIFSELRSANLSGSTNFVQSDVSKDGNDKRKSPLQPFPIESILFEAVKLEYGAFSSLTKNDSNSRELNEAERAKLNELIVAHKELLFPFDDELNDLIGTEYDLQSSMNRKVETDPILVDVINLTAICIRRLIKMAKKINAFKNMCQEDQVALLKGGCTEIMLLRSAMNYDSKKRTWQIPHTSENFKVDVDILKLAKGNIYQEHEHFIKTFLPKWRSDENLILIMCAVILFTPERPRVVHQDVVKLEQNSYYYLLRRYLESIYPGCEAKSTFLKLIHKVAELHRINEEVISVYLNVNPSQVEPLLIEIFDLNI
ncbi:hypothetical protein JTB14_028408 [Gonioctena quinquepunctata]|nr:hypothetical protein JTB14_028408 [Gonioctena quinquepunctata]